MILVDKIIVLKTKGDESSVKLRNVCFPAFDRNAI